MDEGHLVGGNTTVSSTLNEARAKKESPVANNLNKLQKAVAIAQDEMNMLLDVLAPCLSPVEPTDKAGGESPIPPQSDLASFIEREAYKIANLGRLIRQTRNRVEL